MNLFIPQWQDSGTTRELYEGALALKKYIEAMGAKFDGPDISLSDDLEIENNISGYKSIIKQLDEISGLLHCSAPERVFTVGGGCGIEVPIVSYLAELYPDMDVIWFDAHGDLNTPLSSPSGYFHGMPLRFLLQDIPGNDISSKYKRIGCEEVVLIGARDLDPPEMDFIQENRIKTAGLNLAESPEAVLEQLNDKNRSVYIHIDLDVLDPGIYRNVKCPVKDGFTVAAVTKIVEAVESVKTVVGLSILENTETNTGALSVIDTLIEIGLNI